MRRENKLITFNAPRRQVTYIDGLSRVWGISRAETMRRLVDEHMKYKYEKENENVKNG